MKMSLAPADVDAAPAEAEFADPKVAKAQAKLDKFEARLQVKTARAELKRQLREREAIDGSATVRPDRVGVAVATIALVATIMLASMVFSFTAIVAEATHTLNPDGVLWLAAVFIDGAILAYTVSYAVFRWRQMPTARTITILIIWTFLSVVINFFHVGNGWGWDFGKPEMLVGMLIASSAPIAALTAAEEITRMVFVKPRVASKEVETAAASDAVEQPTVALGTPLALSRPAASALFPVGDLA